jgi:uncharacterized membrane protein
LNAAYLHLILNHIPVLGTPFALFFFIWGLARKSLEVQKASFFAMVCVSLIAIPAYISGENAANHVEGIPGVLSSAIAAHDDAAAFAFTGQLILGVLAAIGLFQSRKNGSPRTWCTWTIFSVAVVVVGLMIWTARLGGQIHHPEIR